jgi:hypothetical protein
VMSIICYGHKIITPFGRCTVVRNISGVWRAENEGATSSVVMCTTQAYVMWLTTGLSVERNDGELRSDMTAMECSSQL